MKEGKVDRGESETDHLAGRKQTPARRMEFKKTKIGDFELEQPIGVGTMMWGTTWLDSKVNGASGVLPNSQCDDVVRRALSHGIHFFDSAEGYGGGTSEERLRDCVQRTIGCPGPRPLVATKFLPTLWRWTEGSFNRALQGCLDRLGVECIDIFFIHSPVHPRPLELWVEAAAKAANKGLIKAIGLSNCNADQVRRSHAAAAKHGQRIAANQIMYNLMDYNAPKIKEVETACKELGVTIIAYSPIGQGLLTDKCTKERFDSGTIRAVRITKLTWEDLQPLRGVIREIADARGKTMAQVAINWVICKGHVPLVGMKTLDHVDDVAGALDFRLSDKEVARLDGEGLDRSTLQKPKWRRAFFVTLISILILFYRAERGIRAAGRWACCCMGGSTKKKGAYGDVSRLEEHQAGGSE